MDTNLITPHFSWTEAACHDGTAVPDDLRANVIQLCEQLEIIRSIVGNPIVVNDMYRTVAHNTAVGGAPHSQHLLGKAADIHVTTLSSKALHEIIEKLISTGQIQIGGMGLYNSFVHIDTREGYARWNG